METGIREEKMAVDLLVVGAGYTGRRLARSARARDWSVAGTSRSDETLEELDGIGATPVRWEILEEGADELAGYVGEGTHVVYSIPTLYDDYESAAEGLPRHVRPIRRVVRMADDRGASRFVYLSSTSVYGDHQGAWVDEATPTAPGSANGKMRRDVEQWLLGADRSIDTHVARLAGIYGPGRTILESIEAGRYRLVDGGTKPANRIHVDDIVRSVFAILDAAPSGARLYNCSDGNPKTVARIVEWMVDRLGIEPPPRVSLEAYERERGPKAAARWKSAYRVRNHRLVDELGVKMSNPDVFAGYNAMFADRIREG